MIIKHVAMKSAKKSSFIGLIRYLIGAQGKDVRVGEVLLTNCQSADARNAALEVTITQEQNTRSHADKTYHLIVSFREGESPAPEILKAIEQKICDGLGFGEHQRISVVHHDTDNLHMHIAINKVHPARLTVHEPYNAYHTFAKLCDRMEKAFGLQRDNHTPGKTTSENRAADLEQHAAVESLLGWIRRECADQIREARTWAQLHQALDEHGLQLRARGNGFVITSEDGISVKASSVAREFSKEKLESRLGSFQPSPHTTPAQRPGKRYSKQPTGTNADTTALFARYKSSQHLAMATRADEWRKAATRKQRLIEAAKRNGRLKRAAIRLVRASRTGKKLMYAATSKVLRDEITAINRQYLKERQQIHGKYRRLAWADWLRQEAHAGDQEALQALRARRKASTHHGDTLRGTGPVQAPFAGARHDSVTKKGTLIYRFGASVVRDDGARLDVARGATQAELEAALRLAMARYGHRISVTGSEQFKEHIARAAAAAHLSVSFDDDALERRRQLLAQSTTRKGNHHGNDTNQYAGAGRRPDQGRHGSRAAVTGRPAERASARRPAGQQQHAHGTQPHAGNPGAAPPAAARHHLRGLSELGVVHVPERTEMLLPGDVPDHLGKPGAEPAHGVRRYLHRPGRRAAHVRRGGQIAGGKPLVASAGTAPPPASQGRLLPLSRLGRLALDKAAAPGLPRVEQRDENQQGSQSTAPVKDTARRPPAHLPSPPAGTGNVQTASNAQPKRGVERDAGQPADATKNIQIPSKTRQLRAAEKYIIEREQKRVNGFDIPKHKLYTFSEDTSAEFAGLRRIDAQALALLRLGDGIAVLPVDDATAQRLKRLPRGQTVTVTAAGTVKRKGWSR
ncbi:hypothetical protein ASF04_20020 [Duganella sp. Leaf61]|uniref:TraI/MobA(P) family conjugative relaxase n=1 Tax=Duganella sp. Leaf61 TaxID=1736227 RepID=UPI0006F7480C|nr:TraI/MobA(P) family conjugative relaxase [Duganella sp. Leaf61]KQN65202.1 hypothetical protein ASF04_20020 [Duganella sp. Leaf61]